PRGHHAVARFRHAASALRVGRLRGSRGALFVRSRPARVTPDLWTKKGDPHLAVRRTALLHFYVEGPRIAPGGEPVSGHPKKPDGIGSADRRGTAVGKSRSRPNHRSTYRTGRTGLRDPVGLRG